MEMMSVTPPIRAGKISFFSTNISTATLDAAAVRVTRQDGPDWRPGSSARTEVRALNDLRSTVDRLPFLKIGIGASSI